MNPFESIRIHVRLKSPGFVLFHDPTIAPEHICAAIGEHISKPVVSLRLRSNDINKGEGDFIHEKLLSNHLLLLIVAPDADKLPAKLFEAWEHFCQRCLSSAGRFIHFELEDLKCERGMLGLIVPDGYRGYPRNAAVMHLGADQLGEPTRSMDEAPVFGRPPIAVSMKSLCFLHHRDQEGLTHHGSVSEIIEEHGQLTWRDLQVVLRSQADENMLKILEGFAVGGRISVEKLDFATAAIAYLEEECDKIEERIGYRELAPSVYHLLWTYHWLETQGCVFRGQRDSRWRQEPTLLRAERDGTPTTLERVLERLHQTQAFLDVLACQEQALVGRALNDEERLAIAQHYGLPTSLLDYTRSLAIAAFFATGAGEPSQLKEGDVGLIYYIRPDDLVAQPTRPESTSGLNFAHATGIRFGRLRTIEPELPDSENRIARQQGLFIEGFDSRDLQRLSVGVLYFRQQPSEAFLDPLLGITRDRLLTPDSKLQSLVNGLKAVAPKLSKCLTAVHLPGEDVFGSLGLELSVNLHKAQDFLNQLAAEAEFVERGLWLRLKTILERHIGEARIAARTADIAISGDVPMRFNPSGFKYALDDVDAALRELAVLGGMESDVLARQLRTCRPRLDPEFVGRSIDKVLELPADTPQSRIIVAVGLFIVGLEHLRTVRGDVATRYIEGATSCCHALF